MKNFITEVLAIPYVHLKIQEKIIFMDREKAENNKSKTMPRKINIKDTWKDTEVDKLRTPA